MTVDDTPQYSGKTRMRMAEINKENRERYERENGGPSVDEVKQRNQRIEEERSKP